MNESAHENVQEQLAAVFDPAEIKWKPQVVSGERAMAIAYVNARVVMDRLDEVVGITGWQDEYTALPDGSMMCKLSILVDKEWVTKVDVGSPSEQPDEGDRVKAAVSDALKRAAVKFGIGRYLYRLPMQWCDYDQQKRRFKRQPRLPDWAIPRADASTPAARPDGDGAAKKAAPPAQPKREPVNQSDLQKWKDWLARTPDIGSLNQNLTDMKAFNEETQLQAWRLTKEYAGKCNWTWDTDERRFVIQEGAPA
jgi:hypothetical protein